jgi:hypothetical protein
MVLAVWTTTARHGEPCMSLGGTAKDESLEFVPLDKGIEALRKLRRAFCDRGQNKSPLSISPFCASQGGERICLP